jgi:arabinan endo-1,5-alpha-L-arabinosidase
VVGHQANTRRKWLALLTTFLGITQVFAQGPSVGALKGELRIHDPSTIIHFQSKFFVFGTGLGIRSRFSADLIDWQAGPAVFRAPPNWSTNAIPGNHGFFWAPDVVQVRERYYLYYSVSTWGSRNSAIGLATAATSQTNLDWEDHGQVVRTTTQDQFNAIDPSALLDSSGRLWLAFGSYWSGIKLIELNPATGLRQATNSPVYSLAWNDSIEAACLVQHADYFYLFVNWGQCCRGTNSTYEIRMGRCPVATGPYLDRAGKDMLQRGGTLFLSSDGPRIGPGHAAILKDGQRYWFSYHYYDGNEHGISKLGILPLTWAADGWPAVRQNRSGSANQSNDSK